MNEAWSGRGSRSTAPYSAGPSCRISRETQSPEESSAWRSAALRSGRIEKYLCRQGSQRNAGICSCRQRNLKGESTCSGEMRFSAGLPQMGQWAWSEALSDIKRAWKRALQPWQRHG